MIHLRAIGLVALMLLASCNRTAKVESLGTSQTGPTLKARIHVGAPIKDLLFAEDSLWVNRGRDIVRIDPETGRVVTHIDPLDGPSHTLLASGAGSIWSAVSNLECERKGFDSYPDCVERGGAVHRIDPRSGKVQVIIPFGDRTPGEIAAFDEMVWVLVGPVLPDYEGGELREVKLGEAEGEEPDPEGKPGYFVRIDPLTNQITDKVLLPKPDGSVRALVAGEGGLWAFGENLYRFDPSTAKVVAEVYSGGASNNIAVGGGFIWTDGFPDDNHHLFKIDAKTNSVVAEIPTGQFATDMQWGEEFLWLVDENPIEPRDETQGWLSILMRFDPRDGQLDGRAEAGFSSSDDNGGPTHVETGAGAVWVASFGYVARFDPKLTSSPKTFTECRSSKRNPKYLPAGFKEVSPPREPPVSPIPEWSDEPLLSLQADWTRIWKDKGGGEIRFRGGVTGTEIHDFDEEFKSEPVVIGDYEARYLAKNSAGETTMKWSEETACGVKDFEISAKGVSKEALIKMARSAS